MDAAMRNIESLPGGYNHMQSMFRNMHDALQEAERDTANNADGGANAQSNPLAQLLGSLNLPGSASAQSGADGSARSAGGNADQQATGMTAGAQSGVNAQPLPNPWQPDEAAGGGGSAGANPFAGLAGLGGAGGNMDPSSAMQMLQNPEMRQMMINMMSSPGMLDTMAHSNPQMRQMLDSNPPMRSMFSNPQMLEQMMRPEVHSKPCFIRMLRSMTKSIAEVHQLMQLSAAVWHLGEML